MSPPSHLVDPDGLLAAPPQDDYALLEFGADWKDLVGVEAQLAAALRLFIITRDPLDWLPDRGAAWATSNGDGDGLELPLYVTVDEVRRRRLAAPADLAAAHGPLCEMALFGAIRCQGIILAGAYPDLAFRGQAPRLLTSCGDQRRLGTPAMTLQQTTWEPIGLGAIQDLVQEAFGPVHLDRSKVTLARIDPLRAGCPGCAGVRFGFPGELAEAEAAMCERHGAEARAITAARIARAQTSNPAGWRAIGKGSARINGLAEPEGIPMPQRRHTSIGRNDPCPCGSGRKYKQCCGK